MRKWIDLAQLFLMLIALAVILKLIGITIDDILEHWYIPAAILAAILWYLYEYRDRQRRQRMITGKLQEVYGEMG